MDISEKEERAASKASSNCFNGWEYSGALAAQSIEDSSTLEVSTSAEGGFWREIPGDLIAKSRLSPS